MAVGNKHLGYKEALNAIERESPGSKAAFYLNFVERMAPILASHSRAAAGELVACSSCGAPTTNPDSGDEPVCGFCRLRGRVAGHEPVPVEMVLHGKARRAYRARPHEGGRVSTLGFGERVMLLDSKKRRYLLTLKEGGEFHSHAGFVPHGDIAGQAEGAVVRSTKGAEYTVLRPTLEDYVIEMPRGAQGDLPRRISRRSACWPTSGPACACSRRHRLGCVVDDDAALGRRHRRLRDPRRLRESGEGERFASSWATQHSTGTRCTSPTATRASTPRSAASTGWCSTCPSRGRWCPTPKRCCDRAACSSPTRRRSRRRPRPASS
jgi:hypothetical protein